MLVKYNVCDDAMRVTRLSPQNASFFTKSFFGAHVLLCFIHAPVPLHLQTAVIVSKAWESCDDFHIAAPIEGLVMLLYYRPVDLSLSCECLVPNINVNGR